LKAELALMANWGALLQRASLFYSVFCFVAKLSPSFKSSLA
jgi:hypothetical protein